MPDKNRNRQLIRQWNTLKLIASSRYNTLYSLSKEFGCHIKTVRRDINALEEAGFPVYRVENAQSYYLRLNPDWLDLHAAPAKQMEVA